MNPEEAEPAVGDLTGLSAEQLVTLLIESNLSVKTEMVGLRSSVDAELVTRKNENKKRDKRIRWSRAAIGVALLVATFAVFIGYRAQQTANDIAAARKLAISQGCDQAKLANNSQHQLWEGILLIPAREPDPAKVNAFLQIVPDTEANRAAIHTILSASPQDPTALAQLRTLLDRTFPSDGSNSVSCKLLSH